MVEDWVHGLYLRNGAACAVVDNIGIGAGVFFGLRKKNGVVARKGDGRETPRDETKFFNKRAENYWKLRELFEAGNISIPHDQDLINEISAITYLTHNLFAFHLNPI